MDNPKRENLLNLALDATSEEREKSLELSVGYEPGSGLGKLLSGIPAVLRRWKRNSRSLR